MVISLDDKEKNAKLSLRQTEILAKLNAIVDDICADCPEKWVRSTSFSRPTLFNDPVVYRSQNFIQSMVATCWNRPPVPRIRVLLVTSCPLKVTCAIGEFF